MQTRSSLADPAACSLSDCEGLEKIKQLPSVWICSPHVFLCPRLLRAAILPLKHFYGIKMQVWGSERLNIKEPYVIVCNHQASLDLMGTCKGGGGGAPSARAAFGC